MEILKKNSGLDSQETSSECIWVVLPSTREKARPLSHPMLQSVDWKMQGVISRHLLDPQFRTTTYVATCGRLPSRFLVLTHRDHFSAAQFFNQCEGLRVKSVTLLFENAADRPFLESALKPFQSKDCPEKVFILE